MYPVSDEYKRLIAEPTRQYFWTGKIVTQAGKEYPITNRDIVKGSGYITRQCSGSSEVELGTVYAAELGISLFSDIDRYTLDGASISMDFHLQLSDGSLETVPMGVFYVAEANRHVKTLELKAYDAMLNLDKNFGKDLSSAYPYEYLTILAKACHVELAQSREEIEALTNGTELLGVYQDNDIETWRDFLYYLAQALGCFATMDRFGKLLLVPYRNVADKAVDSRHRFSSSFSDFVTRYTALSSTNKKTETAEYYAKDPDDGLTMNLGVNPLLQFGLEETRKRIINAILDAICLVEYVPFDSETIGDPALDLGDVLRFTGGHADETKISAITYINTKIYGKQSLRCVGKNPRLSEAKSKNDKNISGLINSINAGKMSIYTFTNAFDLEIGEEKFPIINMEFASGDETDAEFHAEAILRISATPIERSVTAETTVDLGPTTDDEGNEVENKKVISLPVSWTEDGKAGLTVTYMLDGHEVEEFHPLETWHSGEHLLNLYYPIVDLASNQLHTFDVYLSVTNGKADIGVQNILATITGQGLGVQDRWDGRITADDMMPRFLMTSMATHTLHDTLSLQFLAPGRTGLSDGMASISLTGMPMHTLKEHLRLFAPIVRDVVETADARKMAYAKKYVLDTEVFSLRKDYETVGLIETRLNRGRMIQLTIPSAPYDAITSITVLPFDTEPFVNAYCLYAKNIAEAVYTEVDGERMVLRQKYDMRVTGQDVGIDRGRLAAFSFGFANMDTVENLEVTNG